jgi:hypothetical protein
MYLRSPLPWDFRGVGWYSIIVIPGQLVGPIFKDHAVQTEILDCFTFEDGTDICSRSVCKQLLTYAVQNQVREKGL